MDKRLRVTGERNASVVVTHILPFSLPQLLDHNEMQFKPESPISFEIGLGDPIDWKIIRQTTS